MFSTFTVSRPPACQRELFAIVTLLVVGGHLRVCGEGDSGGVVTPFALSAAGVLRHNWGGERCMLIIIIGHKFI